MTDVQGMLATLLPAARLSVPDEVAVLLLEQGRSLGADAVSVYLAIMSSTCWCRCRSNEVDQLPPRIDSAVAGRCLRQMKLQRAEAGGRATTWAPILDVLERHAVLRLEFDATCERPETSTCTPSPS